MLIFSIVELCNKLLGLFIVSYIARALSVDDFSQFSLAIVIIGYLLEFAYFSYQTKNLMDYGCNRNDFLNSDLFSIRQRVMLLCSVLSFFIFFISSFILFDSSYLYLALILLTPIFNVDYILYVNKKYNYIVVGRLISQVVFFLLLLVATEYEALSKEFVITSYVINSIVFTSFVMFFSLKLGLINFREFIFRSFMLAVKFKTLLENAFVQLPVFLTRISVLMIVSIEATIILLMKGQVKDELSISYRMALILLPFIIFYLNSNSEKCSEADLVNKVFFSSIFTTLLVLFSPVLFRFMFGIQYVENSRSYASFLFVIPFQFYLNYVAYLSIKILKEVQFAKSMIVCFFFYSLIFAIIVYFEFLSTDLLLLIILIKVCVFVMSANFIAIDNRLKIAACILFPIIGNNFSGNSFIHYFNSELLNIIERIGVF